MALLLEQLLNGLQLGVMLFLLAAGLTLVFGIMGVINLAQGSLYMVGAFAGAALAARTGSATLSLLGGIAAAAAVGMAMELAVLRRLYRRGHLDQVLATFGMILFLNQAMTMLAGRQPLFVAVPPALEGAVEIIPGVPYPVYRLAIIAVGILVAAGLWLLIQRTRLGMLVRAGATNREMVRALGVDIRLLYTLVFGLGALLAGLAGVMAGPVFSVQVGMGEQILITTFVVVVIGGIGSVRGAFAGAMLVGLVDTLLRAFLPDLLRGAIGGPDADALAGGLASMGIYLLMAIVLLVRPRGLFPAHA
ncbi:branched-chain amino acid ABC transporter permease [Roseomonas sp. NAR14]|uniref:Branched-chain amino acid ABC transporter permease n=1 Tax=Roseomonas acroporae TaxID=2937791 RepID=A0A9X2BZI0_9PROT|nr:branched-chain amino acid ABC transporter permease [Roseomonas acroporae]MCK8787050.1 branched-chain amino acid ABC transporter permease [Roseomonas acroporae]